MLKNQNIEQKKDDEKFDIVEDEEEPIVYSRLSKDRVKINERNKAKIIIDINDEIDNSDNNSNSHSNLHHTEDDFDFFICYYSWNTCCSYFISLLGFILFIGFFAAIISYYVFGIKFLIEYDYDEKEYKTNICESKLWIYVLIMLILPILNLVIIPPIFKPSMKSLTPLLLLLRSLLLISLGIIGIVLYSNCNKIYTTDLYIWTKVVSIFTLIIGILSFSISLILGYVQRNLF